MGVLKMDELRIRENRLKQLGLTLLGLLMVLVSILLLIIDVNIISTKILARIVGLFGTIFFGTCFLFILKNLISPREILIVNHLGITDNSSTTSIGFIPWEYINDAFIIKVLDQEFISLDIKDPDILFKNISASKRWFINLNSRFGFSKINITLQSTNYKCEDVLMVINYHLNNHNR